MVVAVVVADVATVVVAVLPTVAVTVVVAVDVAVLYPPHAVYAPFLASRIPLFNQAMSELHWSNMASSK